MGGLGTNNTKSSERAFKISKQKVLEAYMLVKANNGAAGVDEQSIKDFEANLKNNLYKIWNRMSSGCYFPPAVKAVEIPKDNGKTRILGIPTVSDRIAQMIVKLYLEPTIEQIFHEDSYGYRPNKSAIQAVGVARKRCWEYEWVIDLDIKGFFDNLDHKLVMRAVEKHTNEKWIIICIERWLKAPMKLQSNEIIERNQGTPQGGVISPLLANLFLHYALDKWMEINNPNTPFERYADDGVYHCKTREQAEEILGQIEKRLKDCGLEINKEKTKIVHCKNGRNSKRHEDKEQEETAFDFLGFTFRPRKVVSKDGKCFTGFTPAVSNKALKKIREEIRRWSLHTRTSLKLEDLAKFSNLILQGWINYYGSFNKSSLYPALKHLDTILTKWITRKYKRYKGHWLLANRLLRQIMKQNKSLFAHWKFMLK